MIKKLFFVAFISISINVFATDYFVSPSGNNSNNGLTESSAWKTLTYAVKKVKAGDTVWIKAGNYKNENVVFKNSGKEGNPISFIGYKNSPGDIVTSFNLNYDYGDKLDSGEMPLFDGGDRSKDTRGFSLRNTSYIILKNIQITEFRFGLTGGKTSNVILDNINTMYMGDPLNSKAGFGLNFSGEGNNNNIIKNSLFVDADGGLLRIEGDNNLIENTKAFSGEDFHQHASADYYIHINGGNNNIIRNCYVERVGNIYHEGHGIGLKYNCQNNLIENCTVINIKQALEARHKGVKYNTFKNILITTNNRSKSNLGSITIRDGASHNTFDRIIVKGTSEGIRFYDQTEDGQGGIIASFNTIKNSIFYKVNKGIVSNKSANVKAIGKVVFNSIVNCTFVDINSMFQGLLPMDNSNTITNCIVNEVKEEIHKSSKYNPQWNVTYNNYFNNGFNKPLGIGNISEDPNFEDASKINFRLKSSSKLIDAGINLPDVNKDYDGNDRPKGDSHDIGAFEFQNNFTGSAGPDTNICIGNNVTLTATGGTSYLWDTGDTTASITVSPVSTTIYTVTISDDFGNSDSDEIIVTVDEAPSVSLIDDFVICSGEEVTLTASGIGNFLWSTGETTESIIVSPSSITTYTVTASNSCGTESTDEVIITVNPTPTLTINNTTTTICIGESLDLTVTSNGNLSWSTGEITENITVNPIETTTYTITSTIGDCSVTEEIQVTVYQGPSVDAGQDVVICPGEEVILTASGIGNFLWSTGETTESIIVSPNSTRTYTVTASNSCGTESTDEVKVTVNPTPTLTINNTTTTICIGESLDLTVSSNGILSWSTGETTESITVNPVVTTTYTITSTIGDCSITEQILVTVNPASRIYAGEDIIICSGEEVTLTASGNGNFLWNTGETTESITVSPTSTATYTVTASNSCGTDAMDEVIVTVNDIPVLNVSGDIKINNGESITLGATGEGDFLWSTGETDSSIVVSPTATTIYTVTLTSSEGCSNQKNVLVTVEDKVDDEDNSGITVIADAGENVEICLNSSTVLTASGGGSYLWNTGEISSSITVSPTETTTYYVTVSDGINIDVNDVDEVTVYVNEGCSEISNRLTSKEIKVYPNPTQGVLNIELTGYSDELNISLISLRGRLVYSENLHNPSLIKVLKRQINLSRFGKGIYYVRLDNNGESETKKVLVI